MTRVESRPPKFFLNEHCSISYRQQKTGNWTSEGRNDYGLFFVVSGTALYETEQHKYVLQAGDFLLANPGTNCKFGFEETAILIVNIAPSLVIDSALRIGLSRTSNEVRLRSDETLRDSAMSRLAEDVSRELIAADRGHETVIAALVEQIVIHLLRHYSTFRRTDTLELSRAGLVDRRIRRAIELMVAQLDQELSLKELAAASYLSPFHFARLFKKLTGSTPHAYLASLRMAAAQRLLAETDLSITAIGVRVGYSSPSHFSRNFRLATGVTPRAFRASLISRQFER